MQVHPTAVVDSTVELGEGVTIGPFSVIGRHVRIGRNSRLEAHVHIEEYTTIGEDCQIRQNAVLGGPPQDRKFSGENSRLVIGDRNIIREFVTIHRATGDGEFTRVGDDNLIMAYCHIGHNVEIGSGVIMANMVGVSGHCVVEDRVVFGGMVGVHQFVRIGRLAMVGGMGKVVSDVPPYMMADGRPTEVVALNSLGLRRAQMSPNVRAGLKQAYRLLYRSGLNLSQGMEAVYNDVEQSEERDYLLEFLSRVRRGFGGRGNDPRRIESS